MKSNPTFHKWEVKILIHLKEHIKDKKQTLIIRSHKESKIYELVKKNLPKNTVYSITKISKIK